MIISGKQIAQEIKNSLKEEIAMLEKPPQLDIVYAGKDPVIENFLRIKIQTGEEIGAKTIVHRFPEYISQQELIGQIKNIAKDPASDGIIIQLPLPKEMDTKEVLNSVPPEKDVDILSEKAFELFEENKSKILPPVAGAFMEILAQNNVQIKEKKVVMLGMGRLVGRPFAICAERDGASVTRLDITTGDPVPHLLTADIIASGIGQPHFIKPEMIHEGVIILDGGTTSEVGGKIMGDADPACAEKCQIFTPTPGGIGPITVALLFRNLLSLIKNSLIQR